MTAPQPRRDAIAQELRDEILRGHYQPGDRLPAEREIAHRLGAHRSSVREALRQLEQQGLISIRHGGGARVLRPEDASLDVIRHMLFLDGRLDRSLIEEVLEVHEMLIVGAVRLAIERGTEADLERAQDLLAKLCGPTTTDDEYIDTVAELLELIAQASANRVLRRARKELNLLRFREVRKRLRPPADVLRTHVDRIHDAIERRDADAAGAALSSFMRVNRKQALDALESLAPIENEED